MISANKKTEELIIYIANKLQDKPKYGKVMLNKALYFIDSLMFLKNGSSISNFEYVKEKRGPVPNSAQFLKTLDSLVNSQQLEKASKPYFQHIQIRYNAKRDADFDVFQKEEIMLIDDVLNHICDSDAIELSEITHNSIAWKFAKMNEHIPLYATLLTVKDGYSEEDYTWANRSINNYEKKPA